MGNETVDVPFLCRWFGHKCGPFLTSGFWVVVEHRCKRCGWIPAPPAEQFRGE